MPDNPKDLKVTGDVTAQRVARVYAEALLNAAEKHGQADSVLQELESLIHDLFRANPQIEVLLSSAALGRKRRRELLEKAFESRASTILFNFLMVLNDHERLDVLRPILAALRELYDQRARRVRVKVFAAMPLADDQKQRLEQELRDTFQLEPVLETQVDPELIGGLKVRVGDWQYDASLRTQLETIRSEILARSSHEIQSRRDRFSSANGD